LKFGTGPRAELTGPRHPAPRLRAARRRKPSTDSYLPAANALKSLEFAHTRPRRPIFVDIAGEATLSKIVPHLWYTDRAEEAAAFYASVLPNSKVDSITALPADTPSGPAGSVKVVEFTLLGQPFMAISAGPLDAFNHSVSFMVQCDDQAEIDRLWAALSEGGKVERCGWLKDRYGLFWQIAPTVLGEMMKDSDRARAKRVAEAMLKMIKLDIEGLKKAYEGR
jgi:predicted 3-demethylubiquinone-9 3-methyltransferase (glyoxalase superfamily)